MIDARAGIVLWRTKAKGDRRIKVSLPDYSYLVVLSEDNTAVRLITAFWVHDEHQRAKLRKEHRRNGTEGLL